jgi:hypothetical protein
LLDRFILTITCLYVALFVKNDETNFHYYLTVFLIYGNKFYYFRICKLLAVIIMELIMPCSNYFIVHKLIIILE